MLNPSANKTIIPLVICLDKNVVSLRNKLNDRVLIVSCNIKLTITKKKEKHIFKLKEQYILFLHALLGKILLGPVL